MIPDEAAYRRYLCGDQKAAELLVEKHGDALAGHGLSHVFRRRWLPPTGAMAILGACTGLHGIYNLLIMTDGSWRMAGRLFPAMLIACLYALRQLLPRLKNRMR